MNQIFKKCPSCDNIITIHRNNKTSVCTKCNSEFETVSLLDDDDRSFLKSISDEKLENTLRYNSLIMQGHAYIEQGLFVKAEQTFKLALTLCENRYEAYYGISRAKTQDFKVFPNSQDYIEYAKLAMDYADDDIDSQINANLAKINIYKKK